MGCILCHETNLNKFKGIKNIDSMFSNHYGRKFCKSYIQQGLQDGKDKEFSKLNKNKKTQFLK